jgi:hypothetical protein
VALNSAIETPLSARQGANRAFKAMVEMILDQRSLGGDGRVLDGVQLLGDIKGRFPPRLAGLAMLLFSLAKPLDQKARGPIGRVSRVAMPHARTAAPCHCQRRRGQ